MWSLMRSSKQSSSRKSLKVTAGLSFGLLLAIVIVQLSSSQSVSSPNGPAMVLFHTSCPRYAHALSSSFRYRHDGLTAKKGLETYRNYQQQHSLNDQPHPECSKRGFSDRYLLLRWLLRKTKAFPHVQHQHAALLHCHDNRTRKIW